MSYSLVWLLLTAVFAIIECVTVSLVSVWFVAGAAVAALISFLGGGVVLQIIAFIAISFILLIALRPIVSDKLHTGSEKTNIDAVAGQTGFVLKNISVKSPGQVKVDGQVWTAVPENEDETIEIGTKIKVLRISGVKLIVKKEGE